MEDTHPRADQSAAQGKGDGCPAPGTAIPHAHATLPTMKLALVIAAALPLLTTAAGAAGAATDGIVARALGAVADRSPLLTLLLSKELAVPAEAAAAAAEQGRRRLDGPAPSKYLTLTACGEFLETFQADTPYSSLTQGLIMDTCIAVQDTSAGPSAPTSYVMISAVGESGAEAMLYADDACSVPAGVIEQAPSFGSCDGEWIFDAGYLSPHGFYGGLTEVQYTAEGCEDAYAIAFSWIGIEVDACISSSEGSVEFLSCADHEVNMVEYESEDCSGLGAPGIWSLGQCKPLHDVPLFDIQGYTAAAHTLLKCKRDKEEAPPSEMPSEAPSAAPSPGEAGDLCLEGILHFTGAVCCALECGKCGGCGCETFGSDPVGGAAFCCPGAIIESENFCTNSGDVGCIIDPALFEFDLRAGLGGGEGCNF